MQAVAEPFRAVLFPHRSLSRRGHRIVVGGMALVLGLAAFRTFAIGAWPVSLFLVLDVLILWGALHLSNRSGRAFEEVHVTEREVLVRKISPYGRATEHRFDPVWARLRVTRQAEEGVTRLDLSSHGRSVVIGAFLNPPDRESFAKALGDALARIRGHL